MLILGCYILFTHALRADRANWAVILTLVMLPQLRSLKLEGAIQIYSIATECCA